MFAPDRRITFTGLTFIGRCSSNKGCGKGNEVNVVNLTSFQNTCSAADA